MHKIDTTIIPNILVWLFMSQCKHVCAIVHREQSLRIRFFLSKTDSDLVLSLWHPTYLSQLQLSYHILRIVQVLINCSQFIISYQNWKKEEEEEENKGWTSSFNSTNENELSQTQTCELIWVALRLKRSNSYLKSKKSNEWTYHKLRSFFQDASLTLLLHISSHLGCTTQKISRLDTHLEIKSPKET